MWGGLAQGLWAGKNALAAQGLWCVEAVCSRRLQYPLIKEYTLNYNTNPDRIQGIFLNYGVLAVLESLGLVLSWLSCTHPGNFYCKYLALKQTKTAHCRLQR